MNYQELEQNLLNKKEAEIFYRNLYYKNPSLYATTIPDWITFRNKYKESYPVDIDIPLIPPGVIDAVWEDWTEALSEEISLMISNQA